MPLAQSSDRDALIAIMREDAAAEGFHVDAETPEELKQLSEISPMTINAEVWRGKNDDEPVASILDGPDHLGLAWLAFSQGEQPLRVARYREKVLRKVTQRWPNTRKLPIMPTGAIPLHDDLVLTGDGYRVKRSAAAKYELSPSSPLTTDG